MVDIILPCPQGPLRSMAKLSDYDLDPFTSGSSGYLPVYISQGSGCLLYTREGRLIDYAVIDEMIGSGADALSSGTYPIYEVWDNCCQSLNTAPEYVHIDCPMPDGLDAPTKLVIRITESNSCPVLQCLPGSGPNCKNTFVEGTMELVELEGSGGIYWEYQGSVGGIDVILRCIDGRFLLVMPDGSCGVVQTTTHVLQCEKPFVYEIIALGVSSGCCGCASFVPPPLPQPPEGASVNIKMFGACLDRYPGRLVNFSSGMPVYMIADNCPTACTVDQCCGNHVCNLVATFMSLGGCDCLDGESHILYPISLSPMRWTSLSDPSCPTEFSPSGGLWAMGLTCEPDDSSGAATCEPFGTPTSYFSWGITCPTNCSSGTITDIGPYCCDEVLDLEFSFDMNCTGCRPGTGTDPCCCGEGGNGYVVRITRLGA